MGGIDAAPNALPLKARSMGRGGGSRVAPQLLTCDRARRAEKIGDRMALGFYFTPSGFTQDRYDEAVGKLEAAGAGAPEGRSYHVALESNGEIQVFDIWESQEAFEAFGATLVPIMTELGADPGEPMVARVHNVIKG
jgi:hypothetical protein